MRVEEVEFAQDSPLEEAGFEASVPPDRSSGGIYPDDNRSDAQTLFSGGARRRASCDSNPIGVIAGSGYIVRELSFNSVPFRPKRPASTSGTRRFYGAGGEEMATSSLHVIDGVPRCPSRTT
jgi:hypothetical protein